MSLEKPNFKLPKVEKGEDENFTQKRFEEIEEEYRNIEKIPKQERTLEQKKDFKALEILKLIRKFQEEFEKQEISVPGIINPDSVALFKKEHLGSGSEKDSKSALEQKFFTDETRDIFDEYIKEGENFTIKEVWAKVLNMLFKEEKFSEDSVDENLVELKEKESRVFPTDMRGVEVVFTREGRRPDLNKEIARHPNFKPGHTEAILVRFTKEK